MFKTYLNKLEKKIIHISSTRFTPGIFSLEMILVAISYLYGVGVRFRIWLYTGKLLKQKTLPCFVISIGNVVAGGAGKTPMAIYVALCLKKMGKKVVVVSRGYKGNYKKDAVIVSDGHQIFLSAEISGDEPYMMAKRKLFPVVVGKNRYKAGLKAINAFHPDVIVLDDAFQHLNLKKNLDLLLLDYENPLGNTRLLPAGRLREPFKTAVNRADTIIFTRSPDKLSQDHMPQVPGLSYEKPWFKAFHRPFVFAQITHDNNLKEKIKDIRKLKGKSAILFSGIAENASFLQTMKESSVKVLDHLEFKDHSRYKESDILNINNAVLRTGADIILTTEKDWAKLDAAIEWETDLVIIGVDISFHAPESFYSFLDKNLACYERR